MAVRDVPNPRPVPHVLDCTSSSAAPGLDVAGSVLMGVGSVAMLGVGAFVSGDGAFGRGNPEAGAGLIVGALGAAALAIVYGISASRGYDKLARCAAHLRLGHPGGSR